jgi:hypothetical protein
VCLWRWCCMLLEYKSRQLSDTYSAKISIIYWPFLAEIDTEISLSADNAVW